MNDRDDVTHEPDEADDAMSMKAHRDALLGSIGRWREDLGSVRGPTTLWLGIADKAMKRVTAMLLIAATELVPSFQLTDHTTPGLLRQELSAAKLRASCTGRQGQLVRPTEFDTIDRLTRFRNFLAHMEEKAGVRSVKDVGRIETEETLRVLDAAEAFCRMALVDEVICRQGARS